MPRYVPEACVCNRAWKEDRCVVDEDVNRSRSLNRPRNERRIFLFFLQVRDDFPRLRTATRYFITYLRDFRFQSPAVMGYDAHAFFRKRHRDCTAYALACAGNESYFALQRLKDALVGDMARHAAFLIRG